MSTKLIRHLLGALVAVMFIATSAGACAPAPAPNPKPKPAPAHAMTYVGESGQKGYQQEFVVNSTICLRTHVPDQVKYFTVRKGVRLHAKGEGDILFQTLFTWVRNGEVRGYVTRWWIDSTEAERKPTGACRDPNTQIIG